MEKEQFTLVDGTVFQKDGSRYYKSTGCFDKKGYPAMTRIAENIYEENKAHALKADELLGERSKELIDCGKQPAFDSQPNLFRLSVEVPDNLTEAEWNRLTALFRSKLALEQHAFGSNDLSIERAGRKISLSGTMVADAEHASAATTYLVKLIDLAKKSQRVNKRSVDPENEKYAFRTWLLRLGFIGSDYKAARATLLENLSGSAAFRTEKKKEA